MRVLAYLLHTTLVFAHFKRTMNNSLVIAQFRDPYDWVQGMYVKTYHSPSHMKLSHSKQNKWKEFVTKPWTMPRPKCDLAFSNQTGRVCRDKYHYNEVVPCDPAMMKSHVAPIYELRADGSGLPYNSIVDLRRDKIRNFINTKTYRGVVAMISTQYEELARSGTASLLLQIEKVAGVRAKCTPFEAGNRTRGKV